MPELDIGPETNDAHRSVVQAWGTFITDSTWVDIPTAVQQAAKRSILNLVGTALGAANEPAIEAAVEVLRPLAGPPQATVIGRIGRLDILSASFLNAIGGNLFEFDDTHLRTIIHPTAPVAPAALALAEHRGLPGAQVLHAFILGVEIACRLGNSVSPQHYARGWHITASCGIFGSAAASGKLLGLDTQQSAHALGIAASSSSGIIENLTTAAKNVGVGNAARNGLLSALMAERGYTAAPRAVEGRFGWSRVVGEEPDVEAMTSGLGETWELLSNTYKPYPSGIVLHAVVDCCLALRKQHDIRADDIDSVVVAGHPLLLERGVREVADGRDAKVSLHHSVAAAFIFGATGLEEHSTQVALRPDVVAFRQRVRAEPEDGVPVGAARVSVRTTSGEHFSTYVEHAFGSIERPMSDADLEDKVRGLAAYGAMGCDVDRIIDAVWNLDQANNLYELMSRLRPS